MPSLPDDNGEKSTGSTIPPRPRLPDTDAWEEEAYWEAQEQYEREEAERDETERRETAVEAMIEWFFEQFEDPQNETPYDNEDGRYIYPWGGPFEAHDVIHSAFSHEYPEEWINNAVDEVQKGDIYEWAPIAGGDYYDAPEPDVDDSEELSRPELVGRILVRLDDVERRLDELPTNLGHNQPPDTVGVPPYSDEDAQELRSAIRISREEVTAENPDPDRLSEATKRIRAVGQKIAAWLGRKLDLAVDESIKYGVPLLVFSQFYGSLERLFHDLQVFLQAIVG